MGTAEAGRREVIDGLLRLMDACQPIDYFPSVHAVAREAACARNTITNRFGTPHDLIRYVAVSQPLDTPEWEDIGPRFMDRLTTTARFLPVLAPGDQIESIRSLARDHFLNNLADRRGIRRQLTLMLAATAPPASSDAKEDAAAFAAFLTSEYDSWTEEYQDVYALILDAWGRRLVAPATLKDLAVALTALTEGMVVRTLSDSGLSSSDAADRFAVSVLAIISSMTEPDVALPAPPT